MANIADIGKEAADLFGIFRDDPAGESASLAYTKQKDRLNRQIEGYKAAYTRELTIAKSGFANDNTLRATYPNAPENTFTNPALKARFFNQKIQGVEKAFFAREDVVAFTSQYPFAAEAIRGIGYGEDFTALVATTQDNTQDNAFMTETTGGFSEVVKHESINYAGKLYVNPNGGIADARKLEVAMPEVSVESRLANTGEVHQNFYGVDAQQARQLEKSVDGYIEATSVLASSDPSVMFSSDKRTLEPYKEKYKEGGITTRAAVSDDFQGQSDFIQDTMREIASAKVNMLKELPSDDAPSTLNASDIMQREQVVFNILAVMRDAVNETVDKQTVQNSKVSRHFDKDALKNSLSSWATREFKRIEDLQTYATDMFRSVKEGAVDKLALAEREAFMKYSDMDVKTRNNMLQIMLSDIKLQNPAFLYFDLFENVDPTAIYTLTGFLTDPDFKAMFLNPKKMIETGRQMSAGAELEEVLRQVKVYDPGSPSYEIAVDTAMVSLDSMTKTLGEIAGFLEAGDMESVGLYTGVITTTVYRAARAMGYSFTKLPEEVKKYNLIDAIPADGKDVFLLAGEEAEKAFVGNAKIYNRLNKLIDVAASLNAKYGKAPVPLTTEDVMTIMLKGFADMQALETAAGGPTDITDAAKIYDEAGFDPSKKELWLELHNRAGLEGKVKTTIDKGATTLGNVSQKWLDYLKEQKTQSGEWEGGIKTLEEITKKLLEFAPKSFLRTTEEEIQLTEKPGFK